MQPVAGYTYQRFTDGAGTTVVRDTPFRLHSIVTFGTVAGTTSFYDVATAAGTTAANRVFTFNQVTNAGTQPANTVFDFQFRKGLVVVNTGTVDYIMTTG